MTELTLFDSEPCGTLCLSCSESPCVCRALGTLDARLVPVTGWEMSHDV